MSILAAYVVPHPPMIIPEVGRGSEDQVRTTIDSYEAIASEIAALKPETIVISSPHSIIYADYFHISPGKKASGSFARFGAPEVRFHEAYDTELASAISNMADILDLPAGFLGERDKDLDHGTMVPLYFIRKKYTDFKLVRIGLSGLPLTTHYEVGQLIRDAANELDRRVVYIGSGDLSHKLQDYGPYGYAPEGPEYDARLMDVLSRAEFGELLDFDETFCDKAAECGHRSFVMMAGALDGASVETRVYSHEDVTGVGYGICSFTVTGTDPDRHFLSHYLENAEAALAARQAAEDPYVALARRTLECYYKTGRRPTLSQMLGTGWVSSAADAASSISKTTAFSGAAGSSSAELESTAFSGDTNAKPASPEAAAFPPDMLNKKAGVFVSLHKHDRLRGCIGTILPTTSCVAEEIVRNAISAATEDPRFDPVKADELKWLEISVDVLGDPEPISSLSELDVKRYGVIVTKGFKRGLLLPDLDGVDTVEEQVSIAKRKAGIPERSDVSLERFEVIRHH